MHIIQKKAVQTIFLMVIRDIKVILHFLFAAKVNIIRLYNIFENYRIINFNKL